jgi:23S rRNA (uracil1939-C5)-methyltransferase
MAEVEISAMMFGPYGVGRIDGKTVMVPNAAPGDRLEVELSGAHRDYAIGRIARILRGGPDRREPPCPFLPRCGGCDWQQLNYPAQVRVKAEIVAAEFRHALKLELDPGTLVEPAPAEFGYRARIRLKTGANGALGFHELGSNSIVEIDRCMVATAELKLPAALAKVLGRRCKEIEVVAGDGFQIVIAHLSKPPAAPEIAYAKRVLETEQGVAGIVLRAGKSREVIGDAKIGIEVEPGLTIEADADLFSQVNRAQNLKLVATVMKMAAPREGMNLLDLFCGTGNLSIPAARRGARVTGVDADALAVAAAAQNAERMQLRETQFVAMKAAETARFLERAHYRPDVIIMDPPRTGAYDLVEPLIRLRPSSVIYVSCDPSTLVRDLQLAISGGYKVRGVSAFDFFPNTHHVEVVANVLLT